MKKKLLIFTIKTYFHDYEEILSVNIKKKNHKTCNKKINISSSYTSNYFIEFLKFFLQARILI